MVRSLNIVLGKEVRWIQLKNIQYPFWAMKRKGKRNKNPGAQYHFGYWEGKLRRWVLWVCSRWSWGVRKRSIVNHVFPAGITRVPVNPPCPSFKRKICIIPVFSVSNIKLGKWFHFFRYLHKNQKPLQKQP